MKRREFLKNTAAVAALPALPTKVFAGLSGISPAVYAKAVHYAKLWDTSVPEMYTSSLGLSHEQAQSLFDKLVTDQIILGPDSAGIARATLPYYKDPAMAQKIANILRKPGTPPIGENIPKTKKTRLKKLKEAFFKEDKPETPPEPSDTSLDKPPDQNHSEEEIS